MPESRASKWLSGAVLLFAVVGVATAGAPQRGQKLFVSCSACHNSDVDATGPSLMGIVGRKAASIANFHYSATLVHSGVVWTPDTLKHFIADPQGFLPGNRMAFAGVENANNVDDIIAYLETLK
jgi:cytochrome c